MRTLIRRWWLGALALMIVGCAAQGGGGGGSLKTGMTADQAVEAMGQPDLKDNVPDPNHGGSSMTRYTWLNAGEAAVFGPDMRVTSVINVGSSAPTLTEAVEQQQQVKPAFDPIQTPFDYVFYPFRAAAVVIFSGLNCIGGNGCHSPRLPPVIPGGVS